MRLLTILCVFGALLMGMGGLVLGVTSSSQAAKNSVVLSHQQHSTAQEVKLLTSQLRILTAQQKFFHSQSQSSQQRTRVIVHGIESHLDNTIRSAIVHTVAVESKAGYTNQRKVVAQIENSFRSTIRTTVAQAARQVAQQYSHK